MSLDNLLMYGGISALFAFIKAHMKGQLTSWKTFGFSMFISINVAVVTGYASEGMGFSQGITFAFVAVAALTAESITTAIMKFFDIVEHDPIGTFNRLRRHDDLEE